MAFLLSRAVSQAYGGSQARGPIRAIAAGLRHRPRQRRIWAVSSTYTTAQGNTGSLTHWARPGIEPASSWILVRLITAEPQWELPSWIYVLSLPYGHDLLSYSPGSTAGFRCGPPRGAPIARLMGKLANTEPLSLRKSVARPEAAPAGRVGRRHWGQEEKSTLGVRYTGSEARGWEWEWKESLDATDITSPGTNTPEAGTWFNNSVTRATAKESLSERSQRGPFLQRGVSGLTWENSGPMTQQQDVWTRIFSEAFFGSFTLCSLGHGEAFQASSAGSRVARSTKRRLFKPPDRLGTLPLTRRLI